MFLCVCLNMCVINNYYLTNSQLKVGSFLFGNSLMLGKFIYIYSLSLGKKFKLDNNFISIKLYYRLYMYLHPLSMISSISILRKLIVIHSSIETERTEIYMIQF